MAVDDPAHRKHAEEIWNLPHNTLNPKVGSHIVQMMRDLEDGKVRWLWIQVTNPFQSSANANHWIEAARKLDNFIVGVGCLPDLVRQGGGPRPAFGDDLRKVGGYGNAERRTQLWRQVVLPPGEARSDVWQMMEFSKRFTLAEVWGEQKVPGLDAEATRRASCQRSFRRQRHTATSRTAHFTKCFLHFRRQEVRLARSGGLGQTELHGRPGRHQVVS